MMRRCVRNPRRIAAVALPAAALVACSGDPPADAPRDRSAPAAVTPDPAYSPPGAPPTPRAPAPDQSEDQALTPESIVGADDLQTVAPPAVVTAAYRCDGDLRVAVRFDNTADTAALSIAKAQPVVLAGQRPASGIWYRGDGYELRGKGDAATITLPGKAPVRCRATN